MDEKRPKSLVCIYKYYINMYIRIYIVHSVNHESFEYIQKSMHFCVPVTFFHWHCILVTLYPFIPVSTYPCITVYLYSFNHVFPYPLSLYPRIPLSLYLYEPSSMMKQEPSLSRYPCNPVTLYHCIPVSFKDDFI